MSFSWITRELFNKWPGKEMCVFWEHLHVRELELRVKKAWDDFVECFRNEGEMIRAGWCRQLSLSAGCCVHPLRIVLIVSGGTARRTRRVSGTLEKPGRPSSLSLSSGAAARNYWSRSSSSSDPIQLHSILPSAPESYHVPLLIEYDAAAAQLCSRPLISRHQFFIFSLSLSLLSWLRINAARSPFIIILSASSTPPSRAASIKSSGADDVKVLDTRQLK